MSANALRHGHHFHSSPGDLHSHDAFDRLVATPRAVWPTILRVTLGGVMLPHAAQKTLGAFGGMGFHGTVRAFTEHLHIPMALAVLAVVAEAAGAVGLVLGLFTRIAAFGVGAVMVGAIALVHYKNGFFMNWNGTQAGEGFEYHLLALAIVVALFIVGGGAASLDRAMMWKAREPR